MLPSLNDRSTETYNAAWKCKQQKKRKISQPSLGHLTFSMRLTLRLNFFNMYN